MNVKRKKRLLVVSHVLPYPADSGQQLRVLHTLRALKGRFHVTLLTFTSRSDRENAKELLSDICDETICLNSVYDRNFFTRAFHKIVGKVWSFVNSAKFSNYLIGRLELSPERIRAVVRDRNFDVVVFEYWHSHNGAAVFQESGIPCVLDMHNILWRAFDQQQTRTGLLPISLVERRVQSYRLIEEKAWNDFDGIIAINREEEAYVKANLPCHKRIFYAPMGIDVRKWSYLWSPVNTPPRVAYYGALSSPHNQESAWQCYSEIMPTVWKRRPDAELWIIGSNPPGKLSELGRSDSRVRVTGFVDDVHSMLSNMSVVICPWKGKYGFRSRLIEIMATGVPLVTTPDAIDGMELTDGRELLLGETSNELSNHVFKLLGDENFAIEQSRAARRKIEALYSCSMTYDRLAEDLDGWLTSEMAAHFALGLQNSKSLNAIPS